MTTNRIVRQVERLFLKHGKNDAFEVNGCHTFDEWVQVVWNNRENILKHHIYGNGHFIVVE